MMMNYEFATDSESGTIDAISWDDACQQLEAMLSDQEIEDGAWGWVENTDGERFSINC